MRCLSRELPLLLPGEDYEVIFNGYREFVEIKLPDDHIVNVPRFVFERRKRRTKGVFLRFVKNLHFRYIKQRIRRNSESSVEVMIGPLHFCYIR